MKTYTDQFFPSDTDLFYGYPAGNDDSGFLNKVPKWVERLVAQRPASSCIDPNGELRVVGINIEQRLQDFILELGNPDPAPKDRVVSLEIGNSRLTDPQWNQAVTNELRRVTRPGTLNMAQPFNSPEVRDRFAIPPEVTIGLNNKTNLKDLFPEANIPRVFQYYENGESFNDSGQVPPYPCVVKVGLSSSGDGVVICNSPSDLARAKSRFRTINSPIFIEEFFDSKENLCVQFGLSPDGKMELLGVNQQLTVSGEFLGGIVSPAKSAPQEVQKYFLGELKDRLLAKGWYGVGAIDVLDDYQRWLAIDPNLRPNASMWAAMLIKNDYMVGKSIAPFVSRMNGSAEDKLQTISNIARFGDPRQRIVVAGLTMDDETLCVNAGMIFDQDETLKSNAQELVALGFESSALNRFAA